MNNKAIKHKYSFNKDNNPLENDRIVSICMSDCATKHLALNDTTQRCEVMENQASEKKLKLSQTYITEKIKDYGVDLMALILIFLIPTIPFWQF